MILSNSDACGMPLRGAGIRLRRAKTLRVLIPYYL
jgi:hypothetical protein